LVADYGLLRYGKPSFEAPPVYCKATKLNPNTEIRAVWQEAPENIGKDKSHFNEATEVWSFGIFLRELFELVSSQTTDKLSLNKIQQGQILSKLPIIPDAVWKICESCWTKDPAKRPKFEKIVAELEVLHQSPPAWDDKLLISRAQQPKATDESSSSAIKDNGYGTEEEEEEPTKPYSYVFSVY